MSIPTHENKRLSGHGDTKIAAIIQTEGEWADAKIILATLVNVVVEVESQHGVVVLVECTEMPSYLGH